jgi:AmmeMemoRadiSam system protein A
LLKIARENIRSFLINKKYSQIDPETILTGLKKPLGSFVTLSIDDKLRGCIGRFMPSDPLFEVVKQMSAAAAFQDSRFTPLTKKEFEKMKIEISVLGPLRKIKDINDIILGKHGVYIRKDNQSGTFLPQVAKGKKWSVEDFLGHISKDKAGLGWDGWRNADVFIYDTFIFEEEN